jgi:hypothetical protein
VERDRLPARPALDLALGHLGDQGVEALHGLPVEGREHELALLQMLALVEQDHRIAADDRLEDARALAGVQHVGRRGEHLAQLLGVGEHHEGRRPEQADRETAAVARAAALDEGGRPGPPAQALHRGRRAGSRG